MPDLQYALDPEQGSQGNIEVADQSVQSSGMIPKLTFSIEGPTHELSLHFERSLEGFCMVCVRDWTITMKDCSMNLLRHLLALRRWGNCESGITSSVHFSYFDWRRSPRRKCAFLQSSLRCPRPAEESHFRRRGYCRSTKLRTWSRDAEYRCELLHRHTFWPIVGKTLTAVRGFRLGFRTFICPWLYLFGFRRPAWGN